MHFSTLQSEKYMKMNMKKGVIIIQNIVAVKETMEPKFLPLMSFHITQQYIPNKFNIQMLSNHQINSSNHQNLTQTVLQG